VHHINEALKWSAFKNSFVAEHGLAVLCNLAIDPEVHVELLTNDAGKLAIIYLVKFNDYMASTEIGCKLILKFSENPDHCHFLHILGTPVIMRQCITKHPGNSIIKEIVEKVLENLKAGITLVDRATVGMSSHPCSKKRELRLIESFDDNSAIASSEKEPDDKHPKLMNETVSSEEDYTDEEFKSIEEETCT
jgi:hypothetical protein